MAEHGSTEEAGWTRDLQERLIRLRDKQPRGSGGRVDLADAVNALSEAQARLEQAEGERDLARAGQHIVVDAMLDAPKGWNETTEHLWGTPADYVVHVLGGSHMLYAIEPFKELLAQRESAEARVGELEGERDELAAERDFLLARANRDSNLHTSWVGLSSDAMVASAIAGGEPQEWPRDQGDLARCERTYALAPAHLQPKMLPLLKRWRAAINREGEG